MVEDKIHLFVRADKSELTELASSLEDRTETQIILTNWRSNLKNRWQISREIDKVLHFHSVQTQARQELASLALIAQGCDVKSPSLDIFRNRLGKCLPSKTKG